MIVIIDYGLGNLHSVQNALNKLDCPCMISSKPEDIQNADGLILPGVGAFDEGMANLDNRGLTSVIKETCAVGKPILGICLGMQLMFEQGYEGVPAKGLGLLKGEVTLMPDEEVRIPHVGWNQLERNHEDSFLPETLPYVYFVHSYYAQSYDDMDLKAYCSYGSLKIPAYFHKDNIYAMQFHPEKSSQAGLALLTLFKEVCL